MEVAHLNCHGRDAARSSATGNGSSWPLLMSDYVPVRARGMPAIAAHHGVQGQTKLATIELASMRLPASTCRAGLPAARCNSLAVTNVAAAPTADPVQAT